MITFKNLNKNLAYFTASGSPNPGTSVGSSPDPDLEDLSHCADPDQDPRHSPVISRLKPFWHREGEFRTNV
jgi:hypothetical protein